MASLPGAFNANDVEPTAPRELLAPGKYPVQIVQSEMKDTAKGNGQYLSLEMDVIDGPDRGRKLWEILNLVNPNQTAVDIANRTLSSICHATGQMVIEDSEQLHWKTMIATVAVQVDSRDKELHKANPNNPAIRLQNKITAYEAADAGMGNGYQPAPRQPQQNGGGGAAANANGGGQQQQQYQQQQAAPQQQNQQRPAPAAGQMPWQRRA